MAQSKAGLSDREQQILAFERVRWNYRGAKDEAIRKEFGVSGTRYEQELRALIAKPEALAAHPVLVKRLRRLEATRAARRAG